MLRILYKESLVWDEGNDFSPLYFAVIIDSSNQHLILGGEKKVFYLALSMGYI